MMINLLSRGYDYLLDVETDVNILRFEKLEDDCKMVFGEDFKIGKSNQTNSQSIDISDQELDMIKKLNPTEWSLYQLG